MYYFPAGILSLGCFFGCICAGYVMEKIGRKKTLLYVTSACFLVGYLAIFLASNVVAIYIGR
jgi:MFS family permease